MNGERFVNALIAFNEGVITHEDLANEFEEILTEASKSNVLSGCYSNLTHIVENLLLLTYVSNTDLHNHWKKEISNWRDEIEIDLRWKTKRSETKMINDLIDLVPNIYEQGIKLYKKHDKNNPDLKKILSVIPEECPWTLEELIEGVIEELVSMLDLNS